ncbi:hypothetical protein H671_2g5874 [Cricetulus griseus]|nr:hypothetical protein H671_2g5874 [Cricetulus griseus]
MEWFMCYGKMQKGRKDYDEESADVGGLLVTWIHGNSARTSSTVLKRYGKSLQPCLVPDFRGIALSFSPFSLMLTVGLVYTAFIMFRFHGSNSGCQVCGANALPTVLFESPVNAFLVLLD